MRRILGCDRGGTDRETLKNLWLAGSFEDGTIRAPGSERHLFPLMTFRLNKFMRLLVMAPGFPDPTGLSLI